MGLTVDEKQLTPVVKRDKVGLKRKKRKEKKMKYKKTRAPVLYKIYVYTSETKTKLIIFFLEAKPP